MCVRMTCSFVTVLQPHVSHFHQRRRRGIGLGELGVSLKKSSEHLAGHVKVFVSRFRFGMSRSSA